MGGALPLSHMVQVNERDTTGTSIASTDRPFQIQD